MHVIGKVAHKDDDALGLQLDRLVIRQADGLHVVFDGRASTGGKRRGAMDEHVVDKPLHAVRRQGAIVVDGAHAPRLALHVGDRADEDRRGRRRTYSVDDAGNEQVRDDGGVQGSGAQHDEIGLFDRAKRRKVGLDRSFGAKRHAPQRARRGAGLRLSRERVAVARHGREHDGVERRGKHVAARLEDPLADLDRARKRPRGVFEGCEHEIAEGMVAGEREPVFERARQRIVVVARHRDEALADVARRKRTRLFANDAGRAAVIGHRNDGRHLGIQAQERADGDGSAGASPDHDRLQGRRLAMGPCRKLGR